MLFQVLRGQDSNLRPSGYEPDELPLLHPAMLVANRCAFAFPTCPRIIILFVSNVNSFLGRLLTLYEFLNAVDKPEIQHTSPFALVYHPVYNGRGFSRVERSWNRYRLGLAKMAELGLIALGPSLSGEETRYNRQSDYAPIFTPAPADIEAIATVHSRAYIQHVIEMDAIGEGFFDRADTPAWRGVYARATTIFGGTLLAAELVASGKVRHVFNPAGGLHHAQYDKAGGFCIFNDIVGAVRYWQNRYGYKRIAVIDVDGHHGDGTQWLLYREPILTVSLHMYDGRFYPRTGAISERGEGAGMGYSLNFPLPRHSTDGEYLAMLEMAIAAVEKYQPEAIILQYGVDGHLADRMVGLKLSTYVYEAVAEKVKALADKVCAGRLIAVGGGGYEPEAVARCWSILAAVLADKKFVLGDKYTALHDAPDSLPSSEPAAVEQVERTLTVLRQML
jgi:acetoin utilization protein AcuC